MKSYRHIEVLTVRQYLDMCALPRVERVRPTSLGHDPRRATLRKSRAAVSGQPNPNWQGPPKTALVSRTVWPCCSLSSFCCRLFSYCVDVGGTDPRRPASRFGCCRTGMRSFALRESWASMSIEGVRKGSGIDAKTVGTFVGTTRQNSRSQRVILMTRRSMASW